MIDFNELPCKAKSVAVNLYIIGEHLDMDVIANDLQTVKFNASKDYTVLCGKQMFLNEVV